MLMYRPDSEKDNEAAEDKPRHSRRGFLAFAAAALGIGGLTVANEAADRAAATQPPPAPVQTALAGMSASKTTPVPTPQFASVESLQHAQETVVTGAHSTQQTHEVATPTVSSESGL